MRLIAEQSLPCQLHGKTYVMDEAAKLTTLQHPGSWLQMPEPKWGRDGFHVFCSPFNEGAKELLGELQRAHTKLKLQWTDDVTHLPRYVHPTNTCYQVALVKLTTNAACAFVS